MSEGERADLARPRQVTTAGWVVVGGSVAVAIGVLAQAGRLGSLETTRALQEALGTPPASGLGLSVETARELLRVAGMVAASCAAATGVLGWFVLQRSRPARLALSVLALPLFVTGIASGGVFSSVVVAASLVLWLQPARGWFAGHTPPTPPRPLVEPVEALRAGSPLVGPVEPPSRSLVKPVETPPATLSALPLRQVGPHVAGPQPRPAALTWACLICWVTSAIVAVVLGVGVALVWLGPDQRLRELLAADPALAQQGVTLEVMRVAATISGAIMVLWCLAAVVLAALVWRAVTWAHVALLVSAGLAGLLCLVGLLQAPLLLLPLGACVAGFVLLLRAEVRWWLRSVLR